MQRPFNLLHDMKNKERKKKKKNYEIIALIMEPPIGWLSPMVIMSKQIDNSVIYQLVFHSTGYIKCEHFPIPPIDVM